MGSHFLRGWGSKRQVVFRPHSFGTTHIFAFLVLSGLLYPIAACRVHEEARSSPRGLETVFKEWYSIRLWGCSKQLYALQGDTRAHFLLYADGTLCIGLKKAVMNFIIDNGLAVMDSPSFVKLAESTDLMKEVMKELAKSHESRKRKHDEVSA